MFIYQAAYSGNSLGCAGDNSPDTQEPDEAKVSSPVLMSHSYCTSDNGLHN
jgi:hypothetical protein